METTVKFVEFSDFGALSKLVLSGEPFYLVYDMKLNKDDAALLNLEKICQAHDIFQGLVFRFKGKGVKPDDIFYLKEIAETLMEKDKRVGFWGIPPCVLRGLLSGYFFMKWTHFEIERSSGICPPPEYLPVCGNCVDRLVCHGLENVERDGFIPKVKKVTADDNGKRCAFETEYPLLREKHEEFRRYCSGRMSRATFRKLYYVANIDFDSSNSYQDRFIYQCDYLDPREYAIEFGFLKSQALHPSFVDLLSSLSGINRTSQIAYSLAQKREKIRESFYMFVTKRYGTGLLRDLKICFEPPQSRDMNFIGVGIDVSGGKVTSYKLYFQAKKAFIASYMKDFGIDASVLTHGSHYMVLRLDDRKRYVSYKAEMLASKDDFKLFSHLLGDYTKKVRLLDPNGVYNITVEVVDDRISKLNIYMKQPV